MVLEKIVKENTSWTGSFKSKKKQTTICRIYAPCGNSALWELDLYLFLKRRAKVTENEIAQQNVNNITKI